MVACRVGDTGDADAVRQVLHRRAQLRRRRHDRQLQRTSPSATSLYDTLRAIPVDTERPRIHARTLVLLRQYV